MDINITPAPDSASSAAACRDDKNTSRAPTDHHPNLVLTRDCDTSVVITRGDVQAVVEVLSMTKKGVWLRLAHDGRDYDVWLETEAKCFLFGPHQGYFQYAPLSHASRPGALQARLIFAMPREIKIWRAELLQKRKKPEDKKSEPPHIQFDPTPNQNSPEAS